MTAHVWCNVDGIGERVPVQLIEGSQRDALLKARELTKDAKKDPLSYAVLQCKRTLPPDAKMQLVYGKGVATSSGLANSVEKRFDFEVRKPFAVHFTCKREHAWLGCLPIRPMRLQFSARVVRALAAQITLTGGGKAFKPVFDNAADSGPDAMVEEVQFMPLFGEQTGYTIAPPRDFKDELGRALLTMLGSFPRQVRTGEMPALAEPDGVPTVPITVRRVEPALAVHDYKPGQAVDLNVGNDADIIAWRHKLRRYDKTDVSRKQATLDVSGALPPAIDGSDSTTVESCAVSLLAGKEGVRKLALPRQ